MAGKEITMVLEVDLGCERCNKKITRVLEKIKDKMNIKTIKFDKERNVVTISGPFDADKVHRKLCREAGRVIKSMDVKAPKEPEEKKDDGGMEREDQDGRKAAAAAVAAVDLRPLLKKMLEQPKPRTPCTCCCGGCCCGNKQTMLSPAQGVPVPAKKSVCPAPASYVVSGHGYHEAPPPYYGVPVYSIEGWY